jgi:hypothetical protein
MSPQQAQKAATRREFAGGDQPDVLGRLRRQHQVRGVYVCNRWLGGFEERGWRWVADAGPRR